jgi:hypothetical protein
MTIIMMDKQTGKYYVRIKPSPRLVILRAKTHMPPRTTFFERGSDEASLIGSTRFIAFIGYTIA